MQPIPLGVRLSVAPMTLKRAVLTAIVYVIIALVAWIIFAELFLYFLSRYF
jgi:hypothetical protein